MLLEKYKIVLLIFKSYYSNIYISINQDNVILGSDYPFPLGELDPPGGLIEQSDYSNELKVILFVKVLLMKLLKTFLLILTYHFKDKLLFKNGMKFLGIDA